MSRRRRRRRDVVGTRTRAEFPAVPGTGRFVAEADRRVDVAVIVVTYNNAADIDSLIGDLRVAAARRPMRLLMIDNGSSDDSLAIAGAHDDVIAMASGGNLGYAGGINVGIAHIGRCDHVLILNPDMRVGADAIDHLVATAEQPGVGAAVPMILEADGTIAPSLRREPTIARALGYAFLGGKVRPQPALLSEIDYDADSYRSARDVDWAVGAAVLIPKRVMDDVGLWNEEYFHFAEEIDYFRRIRMSGARVRFEPAAVVMHHSGGSGRPDVLYTLRAVNQIRYVERFRRGSYAAAYRAAVMVSEALRGYSAQHRRTLAVLSRRTRWHDLPHATRPREIRQAPPADELRRGAVIIPAYNEAALIAQCLAPLQAAAARGLFEVIVVCNGCTDDTADRARAFDGVTVIEIPQGSKTAALNAGDKAASQWPRLYLDADATIGAEAVLAVLDRLRVGDVLAARPASIYDSSEASGLVRSYYRAAQRLTGHTEALWSSGAYALSEEGHARFGEFPDVTGDDKFIDACFRPWEKVSIRTDPAIRRTPTNVRDLFAVLRRHRRGNAELRHVRAAPDADRITDTGFHTVAEQVASIRGPGSAVDSVVFLTAGLVARVSARWGGRTWERDNSTRSHQA